MQESGAPVTMAHRLKAGPDGTLRFADDPQWLAGKWEIPLEDAFELVAPALVIFAVIGLKGIDGALRHSLHRTSLETLFVPLAGELREVVKTTGTLIEQRARRVVMGSAGGVIGNLFAGGL